MYDIEVIVADHYAAAYDERFNNYAEEEKKQCECGRYIELDEDMCEVCISDLKKRFEEMIRNNFTKDEIEKLNELYDGEDFG